jgi:hypothetical protein
MMNFSTAPSYPSAAASFHSQRMGNAFIFNCSDPFNLGDHLVPSDAKVVFPLSEASYMFIMPLLPASFDQTSHMWKLLCQGHAPERIKHLRLSTTVRLFYISLSHQPSLHFCSDSPNTLLLLRNLNNISLVDRATKVLHNALRHVPISLWER